jgi:hypothetical protein
MARLIAALVVQTAVAILLALVLLGVWLRLSGQEPAVMTGEAPRLLFLFMDIGLGVWIVALIVLLVRRRALPGVGATLLAAVGGVVLNALTVFVVGLVQGHVHLAYAIEAGAAFLVAVLVTAPIIHRLFRTPRQAPDASPTRP